VIGSGRRCRLSHWIVLASDALDSVSAADGVAGGGGRGLATAAGVGTERRRFCHRAATVSVALASAATAVDGPDSDGDGPTVSSFFFPFFPLFFSFFPFFPFTFSGDDVAAGGEGGSSVNVAAGAGSARRDGSISIAAAEEEEGASIAAAEEEEGAQYILLPDCRLATCFSNARSICLGALRARFLIPASLSFTRFFAVAALVRFCVFALDIRGGSYSVSSASSSAKVCVVPSIALPFSICVPASATSTPSVCVPRSRSGPDR
jgi:hypothetical protein